MKRIFIALGILAITSVVYILLFADRRSRLKVGSPVEYYSNFVYPSTERLAALREMRTGRTLVKEGAISFQTENVAATQTLILELSKRLEGYVSSESKETDNGKVQFSQVVRIPSGSFNDFISEIEKLDVKVESKHLSTLDITDEFIDVEARIAAKRKMEARCQGIIQTATVVKDILEIEIQLGTVRGEIESMQGRLDYLNDQALFGTLTLEYYEQGAIYSGFGSKVVSSLGNGWEGFLVALTWLATIWPLIIVVSLVLRIYFRRRKHPQLKAA